MIRSQFGEGRHRGSYVIGHDSVALMTAGGIGDWCRAEMAKV